MSVLKLTMGNLVIIESDMGYDSSKQSLSGPDALLLNENGMELSKLSHLTHHGDGAVKVSLLFFPLLNRLVDCHFCGNQG